MSSDKKVVDLGLLEEDDQFEEFPAEEWDTKDEDQTDVNVWEDNWDDDTIEDDFSVQLSKLNRKRSLARSPPSNVEPFAKKICSRSSPLKNGSKKENGHILPEPADKACDVPMADEDPSPGRRGRRERAPRSTSRTDEDSQSSGSRTPTRSSARLRSSQK